VGGLWVLFFDKNPALTKAQIAELQKTLPKCDINHIETQVIREISHISTQITQLNPRPIL
jgi:hypothetical protein